MWRWTSQKQGGFPRHYLECALFLLYFLYIIFFTSANKVPQRSGVGVLAVTSDIQLHVLVIVHFHIKKLPKTILWIEKDKILFCLILQHPVCVYPTYEQTQTEWKTLFSALSVNWPIHLWCYGLHLITDADSEYLSSPNVLVVWLVFLLHTNITTPLQDAQALSSPTSQVQWGREGGREVGTRRGHYPCEGGAKGEVEKIKQMKHLKLTLTCCSAGSCNTGRN